MSEEVDALTGLPLWKKTWREGLVPQFSTRALEVLRDALINDDPRLIQGATTSPPPLQAVMDWPVEKACAVSFAGWQGRSQWTVAETEEFFFLACSQSDVAMNEPASCRFFLNWYDSTPREEMRVHLLAEVDTVLACRKAL